MTLRYLLDTNVISEPLRPAPDQAVLARLQQLQAEVAIASVVWHELWYGCRRLPPSTKRTVIEAYLNEVVDPTIPVLPYDRQAATWHAEERARLAQIGRTPPFADGQIAAIAATNGLSLVTFNLGDYAAFASLRVEDWRAGWPPPANGD
ncbi:MAG TPA: type II toxin-antitoxin system VapC family toxin [Anaerolineae bacterium]